jgi:bacillithiol synthase
MQGTCLRHSEIEGSSRLFNDYLYNFERVRAFYTHNPLDPSSLPLACSQIEYPASRRAAVAQALATINPGNPSLELLAQPGTVAVLTGQQVGLYGGPVYTLYKALTAIATARQLSAQGTPAVPIFWLATEDHDVEEIRSALFFDQTITADAASDGRPAGLHLLAGLPADLNLPEDIAALVARHYQNGRSFGQAFLGFLQELLSPLGLLFVDPLDPQLRAIGAPFLAGAVQKTELLSQLLLERGRALLDAGYHAQVHFEKNQTSLFFHLVDNQRQPLKFHNGKYTAPHRTWTPEQFAAEGPALSPNALLRPVLQDWLFPTATLVAGPGELAYFAQSEVLYQELLGRTPVLLPRAFFTLLDEKSEKLLTRYRVPIQRVLASEEHVKAALAERLIPPDLLESVRAAGGKIEGAFLELETRLALFDPTLVSALEKSRAKVQYQFQKNQAKIVREVFRKDEQAQRHAAHLSHRLAPHGHLQERSYSLAAMLGEYGLDLIPHLLENIHAGCCDHHVLLMN